ncbi:putative Metal dependent phosphohydrolase [Desulfamplus magnetovallimortis]|uniref:Putative Metal dependent phosphohydrolase n=1 Tax=Desulfamplus magnetovallimortis TaxID=1246637 RepID=A0A1W1H766_9BACT|nr:HD domain-containing protein [Desulfamplus magnetovallimortis]SLM28274.1 putative Metal dependent phosphohydrolase [Desulfamplus magnetovallimortis]
MEEHIRDNDFFVKDMQQHADDENKSAKDNQQLLLKEIGEQLPLENYSHLIEMCCRKSSDGSDNLIFRALKFAYEHHAGQVRKSGEPYINHPIAVAEIIAGDMGLKDPELIAATLLHDIVEDVISLTPGSIEKRFGKNVANFVDGCTKLKMMSLDQSINKDMTYQKLISMASRNPEILLIKIADRIHNMQTIGFLKEHKRQRIAQETIEVYAPLAEKLGLFSIKRRLFELALRHRFPKKSKRLLSILKNFEASGEIAEIRAQIYRACQILPFDVSVTGRLKNLYAFYSSRKKTLDIHTAENLVDFTVIIESSDKLHCYSTLGVINTIFSPVPKSIRDYIANPKINGYRSLHVRITYKDKRYLIKIRTSEMERVARRGLLLHWDDRDQIHEYRKVLMEILKSIAEYEGSPVTRKDMIGQLIEDDKVFVYTPQGDIHYLPEGSIVLDFAYKVHTTLGDRCRYAMVNKQKVTPAFILDDGDEVEIFTSNRSSEITADIEGKCRTPKARSAVNKKLQKKRDLYSRNIGRDIMTQAMDRYGLDDQLFKSSALSDFLTYKGIENLEQFFTSIGQFRLMPGEVLWEIAEIHPRMKKSRSTSSGGETKRFLLSLSEIERDVHKFSQCCNPLPGMGLCVGLLSINGVSLHRSHCEKYKERRGFSEDKIVDVTWDLKTSWKRDLIFHILIKKISLRLVMELLSKISHAGHIHSIKESKMRKDISVKVSFHSFEQSRTFFSCFENANYTVEIVEYGKTLFNNSFLNF